MAEHKDQQSGQAEKGIGGSVPRQHKDTSAGGSESGSVRDESRRGVVHGSTSGGRSSNETDRSPNPRGDRESGQPRPGHPAQPDEMPLTPGSNGGGREDDQRSGTDSGRGPRGTEAHPEDRKAS